MKKLTSKLIFIYFIYAVNSILAAIALTLIKNKYFVSYDSLNINILLFCALTFIIFLFLSICSIGESPNRFEQFIRKFSKHPMFTVLSVIVIFRMWYTANYSQFSIWYDSATYTDYPYNIFLLQTDIFRTPLYPYFLKLVMFLTGTFETNAVFYSYIVFFQMILSLASVALFYLAGRKLFKNRYILSAAALVFGIAPSAFNWDYCILTESLSIFVVVLFIYIVFSYLAAPKFYKAIIIGLYSFIMIMLRPSFVYILAVLAVFFIARFIFNASDRKNAVAGLLSLALSGIMVLGYCGLNYRNYKYFALSSVNKTVNGLFTVMYNGWYKNDDYKELSEHIETSLEIVGNGENSNWITDIIEVVPEYYTYQEIDDYVTDCLNKHKSEFYKYTFEKFNNNLESNLATQYLIINFENEDFVDTANFWLNLTFPFTFAECLIMVIAGLAVSFLVFAFKKRILWHILGLCAVIFSNIFVSFYGAMAEFERLNAVIIPLVMMLLFYFADYVAASFSICKKNKFKISINPVHFNNTNSSKIEIKRRKPQGGKE